MADHPLFAVDVVTPEAIVWSGQAEFIAARTTEGDLGIFAGHEPTMSALSTGAVLIHTEEGVVSVGIHGGFLQIFQDKVTLLTDRAEMAEGDREDAMRLAEALKAADEAEG